MRKIYNLLHSDPKSGCANANPCTLGSSPLSDIHRIILVSSDPKNFKNDPQQAHILNSLLAHKNSGSEIKTAVLTNLQRDLKKINSSKILQFGLKNEKYRKIT